ncbi:MAG: hypothetical protein CFE21_02535 [Bacteroidetes bacterium B1(2017)]|nr:MAG: hypothetical protein CFE21_02535 [Bacteroidetes bacterium B1(2017)]
MKKITNTNYLVFLSIGFMLLLNIKATHAQVDKAIKYAYYFDYERAEKYLLDQKNELNDTMVLQLAEALYQQGKYPQALYYYKIADRKGVINTAQTRRNYVYASTMLREKSPYYKKTNYFKTDYFMYTVIDTFPGNSVNEDFSSFYWNNMLFVTTSRTTASNDRAFGYLYNKMPYLDVYPFTEKGKRIPYPAYLPKGINTKLHDGPIAISLDTNLVVLSRNFAHENSKKIQNLSLVFFHRDAKRHWSSAKVMEFCKPTFSSQHPFYDNKTKTLYFSSDMPGGFGGFDLYKIQWDGTKWGTPSNLGPELNSEYDEVFPSVNEEGNLLYGSDHIETTGGIDMVLFKDGNRYLLNEPFNSIYDDFGIMFKSKKEGYFSSNRYTSKFDDNIYHFVLSEPEKQSLYVKVFNESNGLEIGGVKVSYSYEDGSHAGELTAQAGMENCVIKDSADIKRAIKFTAFKDGFVWYQGASNEYKVVNGKMYKEIYLKVNPINASGNYFVADNNERNFKFGSILDNDSLNGLLVQPKDVHLHVLSNPLEGLLSVSMEDGKVKLNSGAPAGVYKFLYAICSVNNASLCDTAEVSIMVRAKQDGGNKELAITGKESDALAQIKVRSIAKSSPNKAEKGIIRVVNDTAYTTVNGGYVINVRANDRINGKKASSKNTNIENVRTDREEFTLNTKSGVVELRKGLAAGTYHMSYDLQEKRNSDLFGHANVTIIVRNMNQLPGKKGAVAKAENTVVYFNNDEPRTFQLYRPSFTYQNSFESYVKSMDDFYDKSVDSKASLDTFFISHVEGGYEELNSLLQLIQSKLNQGVQVEVAVSAYCSPIASEEYNNKLSTRRLVSVIRYLKKWNDGALYDAIETNRITFWEHAVGELEAPKDVSSSYDMVNESVFGIKASRERRVSVTVKIFSGN